MKRKDPCSHWKKGRKKTISGKTLTCTASRCCGTPSAEGFEKQVRQMLIMNVLDMPQALY